MGELSVLAQLQALIQQKYDVDPASIDADQPMLDQGLDSLAIAEFLFDVEDHFGVSLPNDFADIKTLNGLARLVDELRTAKQAT